MELARSCVEGLTDFGSVNDKEYKTLVKLAFLAASSSVLPAEIAAETGLDLGKKRAYAASLNVILVAAKNDTPAHEVKQVLSEANLSEERIKLFTDKYAVSVASIRERLASIKIGFPNVTGLTWRLDYYLRSNSFESARIPMYFITLHTITAAGKAEDVQFTCSYQELQDLLAKLKDASKQLQNRVGGKD